jgi:hypothetical protein
MRKLRRFATRPPLWRKYRPDKRRSTFGELDDEEDLILAGGIDDTLKRRLVRPRPVASDFGLGCEGE